MKRQIACKALAALAFLALASTGWAQDPSLTRITIPDMHCAGCAKTITKTLQAMPGVAQANADFKTRLAYVKPMPQTVLSPKQLWEAMEKINQKPSKLEGPSGTFTSKPQS